MPIQIPLTIQIDLLNEHLSQIKKHLLWYGVNCFISYSWGESKNKEKVTRLAEDLRKAGIKVLFDLDHNQLNSSIGKFIEKINSVQYVILAGSKTLITKYTEKIDCILNQEIAKIHDKFIGNNSAVVGISLNDDLQNCLPDFLKDKIRGRYTNEFNIYAKVTLDLLHYFAPYEIKRNIKTIIENFNEAITIIKYSIPTKTLLEHGSMKHLQLLGKIAINIDDLLKKDYLKTLNSGLSFQLEKTNFFASLVYLTYQNDNHIMTKTEKVEKCKYNDFVDSFSCETKNIMIQGDSGVGKSMLCKFIVYSWASNEKLLDFKFVFFIKANNLNESRYPFLQHKKYKEIDIVIKECFLHTLTEISSVLLETNINYEKYKILWIIDEYDGYLSNIPKHLQHVFKSIISNPYIILTSRNHPEKFPYYQITGFTEDTQRFYIDLFFDSLDSTKNKNVKKKLLHFLSGNYLVNKLCLIPMYLEFMCNIWLNIAHENVNISITDLYQEFFISIINKFLIEKEGLQSDHLRAKYEISIRFYRPLLALKEISFFILKQNRDIFTCEELEKHSSRLFNSSEQKQLFPYLFDDILKIGIISRNGNNLQFIDPSLKMFFVAKYLMDDLQKSTNLYDHQNFKANFTWFVRNYKYIKNNDLLFSFVSGLLNLLNKNNDFSESLFLKEIIMLFWRNIFSNNLDFVGINHSCLLLRCLKETDYNMTFTENPEIKSYIYEHLPNILKYIWLNNISGCINMFLSVFNDPNIIGIIISLDLLKDVINFIAHMDRPCSDSILSNLLKNCNPDYRKKLLALVNEKLLIISNIEDDITGKYFAISRQEDESNNETFLINLLQSSNLKSKRAALEIISVQNLNSKKIITLLCTLAADVDFLRSKDIQEHILQIDPSDDQQLIDNKDIINELIEMDKLSFLCIDILYNTHGDTGEFLKILDRIYGKATSPSIKNKLISIACNSKNDLETEENVWGDTDITDSCILTDDEIINKIADEIINKEEYIKYITNNYKKINWQTICLNVETLIKLEQKILDFLIDRNIFLSNTPFINLMDAYAVECANNVLLGTLIIKRIFFNCHNEVLTIKNNGIMIYNENMVFLEVDTFGEGGYMVFIKKFTKLFYDFTQKNNLPVEHKITSFILGKETPYYELHNCGSENRSTYICTYVELSEPNFTAKVNSPRSEQCLSEEEFSMSSTLSCSLLGQYRINSQLKTLSFETKSDSEPETTISIKTQNSIATTIAHQRLNLSLRS